MISKIKQIVNYVLDRILRYGFKRILIRPWKWYKRSDETEKFQHITEAVNYIRVAELPQVFFEFGCSSGRTFSAAILAARYLSMSLDAYAFDSFEGLPETKKSEDGYFQAGSFNTSLREFRQIVKKQTKVDLPDTNIVKGFYDMSLTKQLKTLLPNKVGFVHIDVDLYSSTVTVLEFIKDHLTDGTVILFDDWFCFPPGKNMGERRALSEFLEKYPEIQMEGWKNYSTFGKSFLVSKV